MTSAMTSLMMTTVLIYSAIVTKIMVGRIIRALAIHPRPGIRLSRRRTHSRCAGIHSPKSGPGSGIA